MAITHRYTLVCDDVRQENNGKFIVIGLYTGGITVPQLPFVFPYLTFLVFVEGDRPENIQFDMRLERMDNGQTLIGGMGVMTVQRPGPGASPIKVGPVQIQAAGAYQFVMNIHGQTDPVITSLDITLAPPQQPQQINRL